MARPIKNAAMGIIRSGPIPNPGRYVPTARENNPKEILGIFVNPREDGEGSKKKARNGMKKQARTTKRRKTTKKRASSATKRRKTTTRRRKAPARRAVRASNPRRKKRRAVAKRRSVAKRRTAAPRRKKRRSNPVAPGYVARAANPRKKRKSSKKRGKRGVSVAQMRAMLRSIAKGRRSNPPKLTAGSRASRSGGSSMSGAMGASELKRQGLLDSAINIQVLEAEAKSLERELQSAISNGDNFLIKQLSQELASVRGQLDNVASGMGFLDAAILTSKDAQLAALRQGLLGASKERKEEAVKRAIRASKFKSTPQKRLESEAINAIVIVAGGLDGFDRKLYPALANDNKEIVVFDDFGVPTGKNTIAAEFPAGGVDLYLDDVGQSELLSMRPEAIAKAISMLQRNYIPTGEKGAEQRVKLAIALDRLQAALGGRIENPRRSRRRKVKGRKVRRGKRRTRRQSNPRKGRKRRVKGRKGGKRRSSRRGRRHKNIGGLDLFAQLASRDWKTKGIAAAKIAGGSAVGFISVGGGEWVLKLSGIDTKVATMGGAKVGAVLASLLSAAVPAVATKAASSMSGSPVKDFEASLYLGMAARVLSTIVDVNFRSASNTDKMLRASVGLPPTVAGYGSWSPDMGAYYNFQPVMSGVKAGYQVAMAGAPQVGYQVAGMKPGYTVNGYANFSPTMNGYANFAPAMSGGNHFGQPF